MTVAIDFIGFILYLKANPVKLEPLPSYRQRNLMIHTVLVILENMLRRKYLVAAIRQTVGRVFKLVGIVATGLAIEITHMSAQTGFIHD